MNGPTIAIVAGLGLGLLGVLVAWTCYGDGEKCIRIRDYLLGQLRDGATWRGLTLVAAVCGAKLAPEHTEAIILGGMAVAGLLGVIWPPGAPK